MRKRSLLGLSLLTTLLSANLAWAEPSFDVPVRPPLGTYILDEADLLSSDVETQLNAQLTLLEQENSTEIAVVTVSSLQGRPIEEFALTIGRTWGVGQNEFNNGLVVLVAPTERETRIEVGYGLEGAIPDSTAGMIIDQVMLPSFRNGDYETGILSAVSALDTLARGEPFDISKLQPNPLIGFLATLGPWIFVLFWALASWFSHTKSWWLGGAMGAALGSITAAASSFAWPVILVAALLTGSLGLFLDYILSTVLYQKIGTHPRHWGGSGRSGFGGGGGFSGGGFGGGSFGGGGASGRW